MHTILKDIITALMMGAVLPGMLLNAADKLLPRPEAEAEAPRTIYPMRLRQGEASTVVNLDDYLLGVVLAEMPASFETEALKAQAVAARTYTAKAMETGGKHGDGSVCGNFACCQAYIDPEDYLSQGGTEENLQKVRSAVEETAGQVLTYEGELIEATYFSCSGGMTEDAAAVWGTDFPYLRSVESPGEAKDYADTVTFTPQSFRAALGEALPGTPDTWFGPVSYTAGGGVAEMPICGEIYSGTQLRSLLGLRSTAFELEAGEDGVTFTTKGYGHRVGMSQYGADAMAVCGSTCEEILSHYYPGTELESLERR